MKPPTSVMRVRVEIAATYAPDMSFLCPFIREGAGRPLGPLAPGVARLVPGSTTHNPPEKAGWGCGWSSPGRLEVGEGAERPRGGAG